MGFTIFPKFEGEPEEGNGGDGYGKERGRGDERKEALSKREEIWEGDQGKKMGLHRRGEGRGGNGREEGRKW